MPTIGERRFILTNLTGKAIADIICCSDGMDFQFMRDTLRLKGIGFEIISKDDAIKLMLEGKCLAFGCYLTKDDPKLNELARNKAKALYLGLSSEFGLVREAEPLGLSRDMLEELQPNKIPH